MVYLVDIAALSWRLLTPQEFLDVPTHGLKPGAQLVWTEQEAAIAVRCAIEKRLSDMAYHSALYKDRLRELDRMPPGPPAGDKAL